MRKLLWVDTEKKLGEVVDLASSAAVIALDAEMDSFYCYKTKLCLVQMTVGEHDILIDPLALDDLSSLNRVTQDPSILKVFHAGENDVPYFRANGVEIKNIFDTHIAAKVLELPTKSYAGLVERYFDLILAKDQSRADWRLRPLPEEQVAYARQDTIYLVGLAEILQKELAEAQAETEANYIFSSLESLSLREKAVDPDGWAKIKGVRELTGVQRSILHELYAWREKEAEKADLAVFRVAHNGALLSLARKRFSEPSQLRTWAKNPYFDKNAKHLIDLLEKGRERGAIPLPDLRRKASDDWTQADEKLFDKLRVWRNEESERRGVEPSRVFSNQQLKRVARKRPTSSESLAQVEGLESWKVDQYGTQMLELLGANT